MDMTKIVDWDIKPYPNQNQKFRNDIVFQGTPKSDKSPITATENEKVTAYSVKLILDRKTRL